MPFPGTRTNPLGSATIPLPKNEEMAALLESFDPEKHLSVYRDERVEIEGDELDPDPVPPAVAIPFDIFPKGLSEAMASVISGIRDEEVRFPGELETVMVAAYPVYAPYYLTELEHVKTGQDEDAPTTNERVNADNFLWTDFPHLSAATTTKKHRPDTLPSVFPHARLLRCSTADSSCSTPSRSGNLDALPGVPRTRFPSTCV